MRRSLASWLPLLATPVLALTLETTGRAAPITYTTAGWIGTQSGSSDTYLSYNPTSGTLLAPGTLSLGSIAAQPIPNGLGMTYNQLPFDITVTFQPQGSSDLESSSLNLQGVINGAMMGSTSSTAVATLTSVQSTGPGTLPFPISAFDLGPQSISPSGLNGGITSLTAEVTSAAVPEPNPLAIMGILAGWAALRSRSRVRGQASVAS